MLTRYTTHTLKIHKWLLLSSVYNAGLRIIYTRSAHTVSQIYKQEYVLLVGKRAMHLTIHYTNSMPMIWETNMQVAYELRVEAEETVEHRADNAFSTTRLQNE